MNSTLQSILESHGDPENPNKDKIAHDTITGWMKSSDLNTLGAIYALLMDKKYFMRISPELSCNEFLQFLMNYYTRCIQENPNGDDIDSFLMSRYSAARDISSWILSLDSNQTMQGDNFLCIRDWLASLYMQGNEDVKECLIVGVLEHIFSSHNIVKLFRNWKFHKELGAAYHEAIMYAKIINDQENPTNAPNT